MSKTILVAGATGNLGEKICRALVAKNATVRALVRVNSNPEKIKHLEKMGVTLFKVDKFDEQDLITACTGVDCVVSALAGLEEVIVSVQLKLLKAALSAGVPRFIPSDFSADFTTLPKNENRNFDLRKTFQAHLDKSPIKATSIFNGCFSDILRYNTPLFNVKTKTIAYYNGKMDWKMDFTTTKDVAAYTAEVALDDDTPRFLKIASFSVSPNDLVHLSQLHKTEKFELVNMGSMEQFSAYNKVQRAAHPEGELQLYSKWQQAQYLYCMFYAHHTTLDNGRYAHLQWSPVEAHI